MEYFESPSCAGTSAKLLRTFPKKLDVRLKDELGVYGWGLYAHEHLSIFRTGLLGLLILLGTVAFVPYWLQHHPGDLQNAFTLPFFIVALVSVLGFCLKYSVQGNESAPSNDERGWLVVVSVWWCCPTALGLFGQGSIHPCLILYFSFANSPPTACVRSLCT